MAIRYDSSGPSSSGTAYDNGNAGLDAYESGAAFKAPNGGGPVATVPGRSTSGKKIQLGSPYIPVRNPGLFSDFTSSAGSANAAEHSVGGKHPNVVEYLDADSAMNSIFGWSEDDQRDFAKHVWSLGGIQDPDDLQGAWQRWQQAVQIAAGFAAAGNPMDPRDVLDMMLTGDPDAKKIRDRRKDGGVVTQKASSINLADPTEVRAFVEQAFRNKMGRGPTDSEVNTLVASLHAEQRANPTVTTQTSKYDASGNLVSQNSVSSGGVDVQGFLGDAVENDPEAAEYQAAAGYFPALLRALGPMAGMGGGG